MTPYGTMTPVRTEQIILSDGKGEFSMDRDSTVTVLSGYPNVGQVFYPGTAQHSQVVANLAAVGTNKQRIKDFTGVVASAPTPGASTSVILASPPATVPATATVPVWQRGWFIPAIVGIGAVVVIGGVMVYSARRRS